MKKRKLAVIIVYFGKFPNYIDFFMKSASYNKEADFFIFTDANFSLYKSYSNIIFKHFTLENFNALANRRIVIGATINVNNGYKLCDFKPMYGHIFQRYIENYLFWAHCDIDIILGDFMKILNNFFPGKYDIISSHPAYISGGFTAYRNEERVNSVFMQSKDFVRVLTENKYFAFDEASTVISKLWDGHDIFEFESEIESMTHIVKNRESYNINALFLDAIVEKVVHKVQFNKGRLHDRDKEIGIFHFLIYKNNIFFNVPKFRGDNKWYFTSYGIFTESLQAYTTSLLSCILNNLWLKSIRRMNKLIKISAHRT
jgi:hypothetical protein